MKTQNRGKERVRVFLDEIQKMNLKRKNEALEGFIKDTIELVEYNEFGVGLENLLHNLYDFEIRLNSKEINLAKEAIQEMSWEWDQWNFIEELIQKN